MTPPIRFPLLPTYVAPPRRHASDPNLVPRWLREDLHRLTDGLVRELKEFRASVELIRRRDEAGERSGEDAGGDALALARRFRDVCVGKEVPWLYHDILWQAVIAGCPVLECVPAYLAAEGRTPAWHRNVLIGDLAATPFGGGRTWMQGVERDSLGFGVLVFDKAGTTSRQVVEAWRVAAGARKGPSGAGLARATEAAHRIQTAIASGAPIRCVGKEWTRVVDAWESFWSTGTADKRLVWAVRVCVQARHGSRIADTVIRRGLLFYRCDWDLHSGRPLKRRAGTSRQARRTRAKK